MGLNLQPSVCCLIAAFPSQPACTGTALAARHQDVAPDLSKIAFLSWDSVFPICMPRTETVAAASPRASTAALPDPHLARGASSNGSVVPAQPWLVMHEMKQRFHKTPCTNLRLEISTKIHSFQDPKGHFII